MNRATERIFRERDYAFFRDPATSFTALAIMQTPSQTSPDPLFAERIAHDAGFAKARHAHDTGQLSVVLQGTMTISVDDGWWLVPPGLAIWVPPDAVHAASYSESSALINVQFGKPIAGELPAECRPIVVSDLLRELAIEATRVSTDGGDGTELIARLMVLQVLRPRDGPGLFVPHGRDRRLRKAIDILRRTPGSAIGLPGLARRAGCSERTLERLFVTETGMTFGRWREHLRVVAAVDRLSRGESIMRTALALGYSGASSFTTLFTRLLGAPPRRYMARLAEETGAR